MENLNFKFRFWFYNDENKVVGKGRIELLELIKKTGSISHASNIMKMSYRQAWQMVEEMNLYSPFIVVEKKLGGKNGGGACLTENGEKLIKYYKSVEKKIQKLLEKEYKIQKLI